MRPINLKEYDSSEYSLSVAERDALRTAVPSLTIEPCRRAKASLYRLTPVIYRRRGGSWRVVRIHQAQD